MATLIERSSSPAKRAALILLTVLLAFPLAAQENLGRGRITGDVLDENGRPLAGVIITAASQQSNARLEGTSDAKGHYVISGLGTGSWQITTKKSGYVEFSILINVRQLAANPPVTLTLKKITGVASFLQDKEAGEFFDKGNQLYQEQKYDEALVVFNEFLDKFPEIYQARLNIGACYIKKDDYDKATAEFQLVLDKTLQTQGAYVKDAQTSLRAFSGLGEAALKKNDFESARKYFTQALEVSPLDEVAAYNVGEIFFSNQQPDEAVKFFEMAIQIKKDWPKPYYRLGIVLLNKGEFARSLEYLNKCVKMDPDGPDGAQAKSMIAAIENIKK